MSRSIRLGRIKVALPLTINPDTGTTKDADGYYVTETVRPLFLAAPDLLVAAEAVVAADDLLTEDFDRARESYIAALPALRTAIARLIIARGGL